MTEDANTLSMRKVIEELNEWTPMGAARAQVWATLMLGVELSEIRLKLGALIKQAPPPQPATPAPLLYTILQAGQMLGLSRSRVYELVELGVIETVKIGKSARIPAASLDTFVERLRADGGLVL